MYILYRPCVKFNSAQPHLLHAAQQHVVRQNPQLCAALGPSPQKAETVLALRRTSQGLGESNQNFEIHSYHPRFSPHQIAQKSFGALYGIRKDHIECVDMHI